MRITKSNIEFYINLFNGIFDRHVELDICNGGYKLVWRDTHDDITPFRLSCRECYYVILGMFNTINESR